MESRSGATPESSPGAVLPDGARLGRYVVLGAIGSGGMGVVYAARDPELDRMVALKLLRPGAWDDEAAGVAQSRMQREAQAMARLSHPNVIAVHDVGMFEDQMFIAMELVDGLTLNRWLHEGKRSWREVVEVFLQAAKGLAAAHAAGLVHRDFKPGNVMVGSDGRVRVFDFGLARAAHLPDVRESTSREEIEGDELAVSKTNERLTAPLTKPGYWMGTPEYMSPEQLRGKPADALSDQFSFCAALYESLYGERAFPGDGPSQIASAIVLGVTREPKSDTLVPSRIRFAVMRGLQPKSSERFPSMEALSHALLHDPALAFRRRLLLGLGAILLVAIALGVWNLRSRMSAAESALTTKPGPRYRQATFTGDVEASALAPDGNAIAYVSQGKLIVRDLATNIDTERLALSASPFLRWSPDGTTLLLTARSSAAFPHALALSRTGGEARPVENLGEVGSFSPDGGRIATASSGEKEIAVVRRNQGDTRLLPLTGSFNSLVDLDWSPNNNRLAFMTMTQGEDGSRYGIWTIGSGGGGQREVLSEPGLSSSLRWSPRGDALYYVQGGKLSQDLLKLPMNPLSGKPSGAPVIVLAGIEANALNSGLSISRDGHKLGYTRLRTNSKLWLLTNDNSGAGSLKTTQLTSTNSAGSPRISPDGKKIVFRSTSQEDSNLYTQSIDGGSVLQITSGRSIKTSPVWSPDGKQIAYGSNEGGAWRVWIVKADGSSPRSFLKSQLNSDTGELTWAPGTRILYDDKGGGNFQLLDPISENEEAVFSSAQTRQIAHPIYSPDGRRIAFCRGQGHSRENSSGLWEIDLDSRQEVLLLSGYQPLGWSADSASLYVARADGSPAGDARDMLVVPSRGGEPQSWLKLPLGNGLDSLSISPDGKRIIGAVSETSSDVWLVDDFD